MDKVGILVLYDGEWRHSNGKYEYLSSKVIPLCVSTSITFIEFREKVKSQIGINGDQHNFVMKWVTNEFPMPPVEIMDSDSLQFFISENIPYVRIPVCVTTECKRRMNVRDGSSNFGKDINKETNVCENPITKRTSSTTEREVSIGVSDEDELPCNIDDVQEVVIEYEDGLGYESVDDMFRSQDLNGINNIRNTRGGEAQSDSLTQVEMQGETPSSSKQVGKHSKQMITLDNMTGEGSGYFILHFSWGFPV